MTAGRTFVPLERSTFPAFHRTHRGRAKTLAREMKIVLLQMQCNVELYESVLHGWYISYLFQGYWVLGFGAKKIITFSQFLKEIEKLF